MLATRDMFYDDDTDQQAGAEPEQAELENAVIMPMPGGPNVESLLPGAGVGGGGPPGGAWGTEDEETLMPGNSGGGGVDQPAAAAPPPGGRAAQMRRMQAQARASRGGLSGGGMRPPMGAGGMQSTEDDEFSVRPSSRGVRMGSRGPLAPVNTTAGVGGPSAMTKEVPAQISQTEQELARIGIDTVFDPTAGGEGSAAGATPGAVSPSMGLAPVMDTTDIRGLLTRVPPPNTTVQCYIVRKKGAMGMFASYKLYLQESVVAGPGHMNNKFLLSARKRKKQKKSNYLISLDEEDLAKNSGNYYGKVKSNFVGTEFVMHDKGVKPADAEQTAVANLRKELGVVLYDTNVLGTKGPRKMTVVVPPVSDDGHVMATTDEGLLERVKQGDFSNCNKLHNKAPRWNDSLGAYCLNFNGRVTLPSVKNFQLQIEGASDPNQVSLQFGKTGDSTFTMDYSYPLSPLQAFQIVLSSFDHKWACE